MTTVFTTCPASHSTRTFPVKSGGRLGRGSKGKREGDRDSQEPGNDIFCTSVHTRAAWHRRACSVNLHGVNELGPCFSPSVCAQVTQACAKMQIRSQPPPARG